MTKKQVEDAKTVPELSDAEKEAAEKEGVKAAYAQSAQTNFATRSATEASESSADRWPGKSEVQQYAYILGLGPDEFLKAIDAKADVAVPEDKVAGLLGMERAGQNRTAYVEAMMERLGVDDVTEVTNAGPGFTNDVKPVRLLGKGKAKK